MTKVISLVVNKSYKLDERWNTLSPDTVGNLLDISINLVDKINFGDTKTLELVHTYAKQVDALTQELREKNESARIAWAQKEQQLKDEYVVEVNKKIESVRQACAGEYSQKIDELSKSLESTRQACAKESARIEALKVEHDLDLRTRNEYATTQMKILEENYTRKLENEIALIKVEEAEEIKVQTRETKLIDSCVERMGRIIEPVISEIQKKKTNYEKGVAGEEEIMRCLSLISGIEVLDTSRRGSSGDIQFSYKELSCLVEVKNHEHCAKSHLDTFVSTVLKSSLNAGLFVSIRSTIPRKGDVHFEIVDNRVLAYVNYSVISNLEFIVRAMNTIRYITNEHKARADSALGENSTLVGSIGTVISRFHCDYTYLLKMHESNSSAISTLSINNRDLKARIDGMNDELEKLLRAHIVLQTDTKLPTFTAQEVEIFSKLTGTGRRNRDAVMRALHKTGNDTWFDERGGIPELRRLRDISEASN